VLLRAIALAGLFFGGIASAQVSGTVSVVSDYRFRGISLSRQRPAVQFNVGFDHPQGWYGGLFGSTVQFAGDSTTAFQAVVFGGYVTPLEHGVTWDVGADYSAFSESRDYGYGEVYSGLAWDKVNGRVHYSPDYFGLAQGTFYFEVNATQPLVDDVAVFGHVGLLTPAGHGTAMLTQRVDARVGIGIDVYGFNVQLAWVGSDARNNAYAAASGQRRNTVVVSVSRSF
jgi:uncharacterized protein (TIGR02001 family)